ncbi:MAG TPA: glycerophosphodiester phosphodiesterase family protein [Beutenbergiaceae bacterium]|nr:glycerophosphodiester phosphodiesterase family protein [Beutenbergiaceae bacterium]
MRRPTALFLGAAVLLVAGCSSAAEGETEDNTPETETQDQDTGTAAEPLSGDDGPLVVGHRGATGTSPENTLVSIAEAVEMGADIIEIDVQLSSDGEPFLFHDSDATRTTDVVDVFEDQVRQPITSFTWEELSQLDAGSHFSEEFAGEAIPHLTDVPGVLDDDVVMNIEIKEPGDSAGVEQVIADLLAEDGEWQELAEQDRVIISSFDEESMSTFAELAPDVPVYQVGTVPGEAILDLWTTYAVGVVTNHENARAEDVQRVRDKGMGFGVYTVNTTEDMERVLELDVDFIITDYPADLIELIESQ